MVSFSMGQIGNKHVVPVKAYQQNYFCGTASEMLLNKSITSQTYLSF